MKQTLSVRQEFVNSIFKRSGILPLLATLSVLLGVAWRVQHCLYAHPASWVIESDMKTNADWATQRCLKQAETIGDTAHPPGSSILFSLFHCGSQDWRNVEFLLTVLSIAVLPLVWLLARRLSSPSVAQLSLIFACFYPPFVFYGGFLLAEIPMLFFLLLGSNCLLALNRQLNRNKTAPTPRFFVPFLLAFLTGLVFGIASTIKEQGLAILLLSLGFLVIVRFRSPAILLCLFGIVLGAALPLSYTARRCTTLSNGRFCLISNDAAQNMLYGVDPDLHIMEFEANGSYLVFGSPAAYARGARATLHFDFLPWEQEKLMPIVWQKVRERPLAVLQLMLQHLYDLLGGSPLWPMIGDHPTWYSASGNLFFFWIVLLPLGTFLLLSVGGLRIAAPPDSWILVVPLFASLALSLIASGEARYRIPCDGYFLIVAAYFWVALGLRIKHRGWRGFLSPPKAD